MLDYKIRTFLELCTVMNYRKTAENLNITQPGVTKHIKQLEEEYNCNFFEYKGRILTKTKEGILFEKYARSFHYNDEVLREKLVLSGREMLRIGATKSIGHYVILNHISEYVKADITDISVSIENTKNLLKLILEGKLDFALIEGYFDKNEYGYKLYKEEEFVGICSKEHRFSGKKVNLIDIFKERLILREEGSGTRTVLEELIKERDFSINSFKSNIIISDFSIINNLVKENLGISFVYKAVVENEKNIGIFRINDYKIFREFNYVYLKNAAVVDKIERFHEYKE